VISGLKELVAVPPERLYTATEYDLAMMPDEIYRRYGGKVCGPPAIDRRFKTIDFLVLLDVAALSTRARRSFFG
jgi:putative hemolysin